MPHKLRVTRCQQCGKEIRLTGDHRRRGIIPKYCLPPFGRESSRCKLKAYWDRKIRREQVRQSATYAALETIWKAKREYRAERKAQEAVWLDSLRQRMETANKARGR